MTAKGGSPSQGQCNSSGQTTTTTTGFTVDFERLVVGFTLEDTWLQADSHDLEDGEATWPSGGAVNGNTYRPTTLPE